jgi:hypothetical protein
VGGAKSAPFDDREVFHEPDPSHFVSLTRSKDWRYVLVNSHSKLSSEVGGAAVAAFPGGCDALVSGAAAGCKKSAGSSLACRYDSLPQQR